MSYVLSLSTEKVIFCGSCILNIFVLSEFQPTCYRIPKHIIFNSFMLKSNNRTVKNGEQDTKKCCLPFII